MLNIYIKVTVEEKWYTQNFDFLSLKRTSPDQFLGAPIYTYITEFSKFLLQLKYQRSGSKIKKIDVLKLKSPCFFVEQKYKL